MSSEFEYPVQWRLAMSKPSVPVMNLPIEIPPEIGAQYSRRRRTEKPTGLALFYSYPMAFLGNVILFVE